MKTKKPRPVETCAALFPAGLMICNRPKGHRGQHYVNAWEVDPKANAALRSLKRVREIARRWETSGELTMDSTIAEVKAARR